MGGQSSTTRENASKRITKKVENSTSILQKGLDVLTKATEEDKNQNYEEALRLYVQGVIYFLHVSKYHTELQSTKDRIKEKCEMYIERIKKVKTFLNRAHGYGIVDHLETLSDRNVLDLVTEIILMGGDNMALKLPEK